MNDFALPSSNETLLLENARLTQELQSAKIRFEKLTANLNEVVFSITSEGNFTFLNFAWERITGFAVEKSLHKSIVNYLYYEDAKHVLAKILNPDVSQIERHAEFRITTKDRQIRWLALIAEITKTDNNTLLEITGTLLDITDRVSVQQALTQSEERYELVASSFNDGLWDWDVTDDSVYFSPRWKEMLGYHRDELPNAFTTWSNLIHPDDFNHAMESLKTFLDSDESFYESIHRLRHRNGEWVWILDRGIAIRDSNDKPVRLFGSHTDITKLRKIEEILLQRERELSDIVSISPDGIVTFNQQNIVSSVNPAFLKMTGFDASELLELNKAQFDQKMIEISDSKYPYRNDIKHEESLLIWLLNENSKESTALPAKHNQFTFNFKSKKPHHRVLRLTKYCLNTMASSTIIYFRDVTLETEIDQMKSEFLSVAAHELRMPISTIYGYSELLLNREFDDMTRHDILQAIYGLCTNIIELINHLLDLARIEANCAQFFEFESQPLTRIIKETLNDFNVRGDFRKIEVHYFTDESAVIYADRDQLKRALVNVLSNAFKYSPNGQNVELEIKPRINQRGLQQIGIIVKDKGIGISPENLPHIFDRFWRAENVRDIIGTGLGLALVKEIVELHHGEIEVQSSAGKGTSFSLWFPVTDN